jgi:hypothetical protein
MLTPVRSAEVVDRELTRGASEQATQQLVWLGTERWTDSDLACPPRDGERQQRVHAGRREQKPLIGIMPAAQARRVAA